MLKFVVIGHIDHGKSTFIGRLLLDTDSISIEKKKEINEEYCFVTDYFKEEREQKMTIDTSQIFFEYKKRKYAIIDVPGHRKFLKNMITGANYADAAILIIDVTKSVKEQTKRHIHILNLLGIKQIIVVINKMDLVNYNQQIFERIKGRLQFKNMKISNIIPVSSKLGDNIVKKSNNMRWYNGKPVIESLNIFYVHQNLKNLRLPVQDIYEINGRKIIVGRIEAGKLKAGEKLNILPTFEKITIKTIETFKENKDDAFCGENIGLTIKEKKEIKRGDIFCDDKLLFVTNKFIGTIFWIAPYNYIIKEELIFKNTTQKTGCVIEKIKSRIDSVNLNIIEENSSILKENEIGNIEISTHDLIVVENFLSPLNKFVLEKEGKIVAYGIVKKDNLRAK